LVTVVGHGAYWEWKQSNIEKEKINIEHQKQALDLRDKIFNSFNEINELSIEYLTVSKNDTIFELKKILIKEKFNLLSDDIRTYEESLAKIENRKVRSINYPYPFKDITPPSAPSSKIKITVSETWTRILLKNIPPLLFSLFLFWKFKSIHKHINRNNKKYLLGMALLDILCFLAYLPTPDTILNLANIINFKELWKPLLLMSLIFSSYGLLRARVWAYWLYYMQFPIRLFINIYTFWFIYYSFDAFYILPENVKIVLVMTSIFLESCRLFATIQIHKNCDKRI